MRCCTNASWMRSCPLITPTPPHQRGQRPLAIRIWRQRRCRALQILTGGLASMLGPEVWWAAVEGKGNTTPSEEGGTGTLGARARLRLMRD